MSTGSGVDVQVTVKALRLALCDVLLVPACLSIDLSMSDGAGPAVLYLVEGGRCDGPVTPQRHHGTVD